MNKIDLFRRIYHERVKRDEWIDRIPSEINGAFFDNPVVQSYESILADLVRTVYTQEELDCVLWFIDEWMNNNELEWIVDGSKYRFKDIDEYIDFLSKHRLLIKD